MLHLRYLPKPQNSPESRSIYSYTVLHYDILGVSIPSTSIPVSPGRNLAVVLETAAINNRQKKMGYNAARELLIRLGLDDKLD